jgi:hypothetical protein
MLSLSAASLVNSRLEAHQIVDFIISRDRLSLAAMLLLLAAWTLIMLAQSSWGMKWGARRLQPLSTAELMLTARFSARVNLEKEQGLEGVHAYLVARLELEHGNGTSRPERNLLSMYPGPVWALACKPRGGVRTRPACPSIETARIRPLIRAYAVNPSTVTSQTNSGCAS